MGVYYVKMAEEATFNTKSAYTGAFLEVIDPEACDVTPQGDNAAIWQGISRTERRAVLAPYGMGGNLNMLCDLSASLWLWRWFFGAGGYSVDGAGAPDFVHTFIPDFSTLMTSFTLMIGKDRFQEDVTGCIINTLSIQATDNFVRAVAGILGAKNAKSAVDTAPVFTEGPIYAPHDMAYSFSAGDVTAKIESFQLDCQLGLNIDEGRSHGSRFPRRAFRGAYMFQGQFQMSFINEDELTRFWGNATAPIATGLPTNVPVIVNIGADYTITLGRGIYMTFSQPIAGRNRIVQNATMRFIADEAGEDPAVQVDVTNAKETYVPA